MTHTEKHDQAMQKVWQIAIAQGWNPDTLLNLVLEYFENTETTIYLAGFLAAIAEDENK